jgi:Rad3-related DNA helicase
LYKSYERVSLRLPHPRLGELRGFLERLSEDILEYSPQAVDLREQLARAQSSLASRRDILTRNLALLDQADTAGTLAIEREMLGLIQEVENLQAAVQKLTVDRLGRLFVSCSYFSRRDPPATRHFRRFHHRMVLISEDGGRTWRFATTADFLGGILPE